MKASAGNLQRVQSTDKTDDTDFEKEPRTLRAIY
jgi:hypothetical protein